MKKKYVEWSNFQKKSVLLFFLGVFLIQITFAQKNISGLITSSDDNTPLIGVNILEKGTTHGTVSGADGKYTLSVSGPDAVLVYSFIGFLTQEIPVVDRTVIDIILAADVRALDEVVVVGYGTTKKSDLTGSVASVTSKNFQSEPVKTFSQAIQGRAAGVVVTNNSGAPGGVVKVRIRGTSSLYGINDPLYIVDGVALNINIADLNVNDIESMEVLKDASATAVYGNRGANGVVMITTKRGISEVPQIQLNIAPAFSNVAYQYDLMDAGTFAEFVNVYKPGYFTDQQISDYKTNGGTDWQKEIFRTGITQNYQLSASGGSARTKYFLSGQYLDQSGILLNTSQTRYSLRSNITTELSKKFKLEVNLFGGRIKGLNNLENGNKTNPVISAVFYSPTFPVYTEFGTWNRFDNLCGPLALNPKMVLEERYSDNLSNSLTSNIKLNYKIINDLSLDIIFGADVNSYQSGSYENSWINASATKASIWTSNNLFWQNSNILTYHKNLNNVHDIVFTGVYEQSRNTYETFTGNGSGVDPITVGYHNLGISQTQTTTSGWSQWSLQSFLGRISYSLLNRYLVTLSYRADGTSKFQDPNKWGYFPSAAVAWKVSEEAFLKDNNVISNLKLRGSWGITGNQGIDSYATIAKIGSMMNTFGLSQSLPGSIVSGIDNPDLKWESTTQTNVGLDLSFISGRVNLSADYFMKETNDLLFGVTVPAYNGGGTVNRNIGTMENNGVEIVISGVPVSTGKFRWDASFNFTSIKNELTSLGQDTFLLGGNYASGLTMESPFCLKVGESLGSFWGFEWQGIYTSAEAAEAAVYGFKPGDNKFMDSNHDNKLDSKDKHVIGSALPDFVWGFNNTFVYKNFELNIFLLGQQGNKMLNLPYACASVILSDATTINHMDGLNYWTPENENAAFANPTNSSNKNEVLSTQFLQDASFTKIKNMALSYNIGKNVLRIADLKLTVSAQNLLTITKYKGYDPESSTSSNDIDGAVDVGAYPSARTFTIGIQARF
jgi:TonB-dependent starch-binding outer membrane protein SusC